MSSTEDDVRHAPTADLVELLRRGCVREGISRAEQRYWLSEVAFELAERQGPRWLAHMLGRGDLQPDAVAAVVEAAAPALSDPSVRSYVRTLLDTDDDHLVATALRTLASAGPDDLVSLQARALLTHDSSLVRIAALTTLTCAGAPDASDLLSDAMDDADHLVREAALDLADDLAAAGCCSGDFSRRLLEAADADSDPGVRTLASTRQSLRTRASSPER